MELLNRRWVFPGLVLLVALSWTAGHFGDDAHGALATTLVDLAHLVPIVVVAGCLVAALAGVQDRRWQRPLLAVALCVKALTVFAIVWAFTHATGFGPRSVTDWLPIGAANAGGGLVLLAFIRSRGSSPRRSAATA